MLLSELFPLNMFIVNMQCQVIFLKKNNRFLQHSEKSSIDKKLFLIAYIAYAISLIFTFIISTLTKGQNESFLISGDDSKNLKKKKHLS